MMEDEMENSFNILKTGSIDNIISNHESTSTHGQVPDSYMLWYLNGQMQDEPLYYFPQEDIGSEITIISEESDYTSNKEDGVEIPDKKNETGNDSISALESEDVALKQLMSSNTRSSERQHNVIMFSGTDALHGQTIHQISYNDPYYECLADGNVMNKDVIEEVSNLKKYQCAKCQQIFNQISKFKEHITGHGLPRNTTSSATSRTSTKVTCKLCGKKLKSLEMFEVCFGHGDPDRECSVCRKAFASKCSLRAHKKIHNRKYHCQFCIKSFVNGKSLKTHTVKAHLCKTMKMDVPDDLKNPAEKMPMKNTLTEKKVEGKKGSDGDESYIIKKAISHEMFLYNGKKHSGCKQCNVCPKTFTRTNDLKRHLIEHILTNTRIRNPVNANGTLDIKCCLCEDSLSLIAKYKNHLRVHAYLTIYTCMFCDKSFSDSSNFAKHKKVHVGFTSFQCELCQRKFTSNNSLQKHMVYHNKNTPVPCKFCDKLYHFESTLKKHIKMTHKKESTSTNIPV